MNVAGQNHRDPWFAELYKSVLEDTKFVYQTKEGTPFIFPGTGTGGWEVGACVGGGAAVGHEVGGGLDVGLEAARPGTESDCLPSSGRDLRALVREGDRGCRRRLRG